MPKDRPSRFSMDRNSFCELTQFIEKHNPNFSMQWLGTVLHPCPLPFICLAFFSVFSFTPFNIPVPHEVFTQHLSSRALNALTSANNMLCSPTMSVLDNLSSSSCLLSISVRPLFLFLSCCFIIFFWRIKTPFTCICMIFLYSFYICSRSDINALSSFPLTAAL